MTHGQTDDLPDISKAIIVEGPERISYLEAAKRQLLQTDVDSKQLHMSPGLRIALRDEWLRMEDKIERLVDENERLQEKLDDETTALWREWNQQAGR